MKHRDIEDLRRRYPEGTEIVLSHMEGEPQMLPGLKGTVKHVDDIGQIHVRWENGSGLALNLDVDSFTAKPPSLDKQIAMHRSEAGEYTSAAKKEHGQER